MTEFLKASLSFIVIVFAVSMWGVGAVVVDSVAPGAGALWLAAYPFPFVFAALRDTY